MNSDYIEMLETVVRVLVDNPDSVEIKKETDERGVLVSLKVAPSDMGRVIGREGNTAKALRTLLRAAGMKESANVSLKILEPYAGRKANEV